MEKKGIMLHRLSGDWICVDYRQFTITTICKDFLINMNNRSYALDWPKDQYISISDLTRLVKHKWVYIDEVDTDSCCGDCDGYKYNCDDYSCENGCDNCGGRTFICNDARCFYHRYKSCIQIKLDSAQLKEDTSNVMRIMEQILMPFSNHSDLYQEHAQEIDSVFRECLFLRQKLSHPSLDACWERYNQMVAKENDRNVGRKHTIELQIIANEPSKGMSRTLNYRLYSDAFQVGRNLLGMSKDLSLEGYDFILDDYVQTKINFNFHPSVSKSSFVQQLGHLACVSHITLVSFDGEIRNYRME